MNLKKLITIAALVITAGAALGITVFKPTATITGPDGRQITIRLQDTPSPFPINAAAVRTMPPSKLFEINGAALMKPKTGASQRRERDTTYTVDPNPPASGGGLFRTSCQSSHMLFDDPIVYPGQPGKSHLHAFFGNSDVNGLTDVAGTNLANYGRSTCLGGTINRSGYWVPVLVDTRTGKPVIPDINLVYYKNDSDYYGAPSQSQARRSLVQVPPSGLRMIAGNPSNSVDTVSQGIISWECIPQGVGDPHDRAGNIPLTCLAGEALTMVVFFPSCWDGVNLDSPSHGTGTINGVPGHMAYQPNNGYDPCPSTHPVPLPNISFHVRYTVKSQSDLPYLRLSSDNYALDVPAGRSVHGDWINGWDQAYLAKIRTNCWIANRDCSVGFSNDGKQIY